MGALGSKARSPLTIKDCILWKSDRSPPCRAVLMVLDALKINIQKVDVTMEKGDKKHIDMSVLNPLQTVPVLKDKNLVLYDSHAICTYLANRTTRPDLLIPQDPGARALVDQLLFYNSGVLHPRYRAAVYPIVTGSSSFISPFHIYEIENSYHELEMMLGSRVWFGGQKPNLADICLSATISTLNVLKPLDKKKFPRVSCWLHLMSQQEFYVACNRPGLEDFARVIDQEENNKFMPTIPQPRKTSIGSNTTDKYQETPS